MYVIMAEFFCSQVSRNFLLDVLEELSVVIAVDLLFEILEVTVYN